MSSVIAIDQGTTGSGVHTLDLGGEFRSGRTIDHQQFYPQPGWVEHDAEELVGNVAALIAEEKQHLEGIHMQLSALGEDINVSLPLLKSFEESKYAALLGALERSANI